MFKHAANKIIRKIVDVPTETDRHGAGKAFMIADDGTMYVTTTQMGHDKIIFYLMNHFDGTDEQFWDWYYDNVILRGRIGEHNYVLYRSDYPNIENIIPQVDQELQDMGLEKEDEMYRVAAM